MKNQKLMKSFRKSFQKGDDMQEEEMEQGMKPATLYQSKKNRRVSLNRDFDDETEPHSQVYGSDGHSTDENRMYGENAESNDEGYDSTAPESESEYEEELNEQIGEDSQPMLPKSQRKRMAVAVLSKKLSKPKKSNY